MRSLLRTDDPLIRDVLALSAAVFVVGLSFGAIATAAGIPIVKIAAMSAFVFAGGSQFLAAGIVSAGGSMLAVVLTGLLLNARHLPFGLAIGDTIGGSTPARLVGSHLMTDEAVAFALAQAEPGARRRAYWTTGVALFITWNIATLAGAAAGSAMGDPNTFGVDAAFPAALLALIMPSLRDTSAPAGAGSAKAKPARRARPGLRVGLAGMVLALVATPFLPSGLPVLVALLGLVFAIPVPEKAGRRIGPACSEGAGHPLAQVQSRGGAEPCEQNEPGKVTA
jgi:4-azaleucine resistance transporter AzlC